MSEKFFTEKLKHSAELGINFDKRIIHVFGELTADIGTNLRVKYNMISQWWKNVEQKDMPDLTLDISSYGGSIYSIFAALDFYDEVLREDNLLINTRAQGICMSAATILLAGGTGVRSATKRCKFMLHDLQIDGIGGTANQVQSTVKNISDEQLELFVLYAQYSRKGKEPLNEKDLMKEAKKWLKQYTRDSIDHYVSSDEVLKLNLIDQILV